MSFAIWETIPPATELRELFTTSLLVHTNHQGPGVLLRCSAGLEEGSAVVVHASTSQPNVWHMAGVDDDTQIGSQAQALIPASAVRVVAIPHITWRHPERRGRRWRTPVVALGVLASGVSISLLHPPLTALAAIPVAALVGLVLWLLLRRQVPTGVAPDGGVQVHVNEVVHHALTHAGMRAVADALAHAPRDAGITV